MPRERTTSACSAKAKRLACSAHRLIASPVALLISAWMERYFCPNAEDVNLAWLTSDRSRINHRSSSSSADVKWDDQISAVADSSSGKRFRYSGINTVSTSLAASCGDMLSRRGNVASSLRRNDSRIAKPLFCKGNSRTSLSAGDALARGPTGDCAPAHPTVESAIMTMTAQIFGVKRLTLNCPVRCPNTSNRASSRADSSAGIGVRCPATPTSRAGAASAADASRIPAATCSPCEGCNRRTR